MSYDDFKEFTIDKSTNGKCGDDAYVSYSTLDRLKQDTSVPSPTTLQITTSEEAAFSLSWEPPADYSLSPEKYLGFFVLRNEGGTAPTKYKDPNTPNAQVVYIGRANRLGDSNAAGMQTTSEMLSADIGLKMGETYSYSVFTIKSDFTNSAAVTSSALLARTNPTVWYESFRSCTISSAASTLTCGTNSTWELANPTLISIGISDDPLFKSSLVRLQGDNNLSASITSAPIPLIDVTKGEKLEPNTIYHIVFLY